MNFFQKTYELFSFPSIDSTNSTAQQLYRPYKPLPIVLAEQQTAGRGTQGRKWYSPKGNLFLSFVVEEDFTSLQTGQLSLLIGIAVLEVLKRAISEGNFLCKWPNDILLNNKKVGGILIEKAFYDNHFPYFIIGIGLNIETSYSASSFPSTSLKEENYSYSFDKENTQWWGIQILTYLSIIYNNWLKEGFEPWQKLWNTCCYGWGKEVRLRESISVKEGVFAGISPEGALRIENQGDFFSIFSGTIEYFDKKAQ